MISAADLVAMQAAQAAALPDTCSIVRDTLASDGMGGQTRTPVTVASGVACRLASSRYKSGEIAIAERTAVVTSWMLTLAAGTDIRQTDRVTIAGVTYEVVGLESGGTWETAKRAQLVQVG